MASPVYTKLHTSQNAAALCVKMKILKAFALIIVVLVGGFIFLATASSTKQNYECTGDLTQAGNVKEAKLYVTLERYRPWVALWNWESKGNLKIEIPNQSFEYFPIIKEAGQILQIADFDGELKGTFSTVSLALQIDTSRGFFDGNAREIER